MPADDPMSELRDLRVKVHAQYVVKLNALKILRGQAVYKSVEEALDAYFAKLEAEKAQPSI